MFDRPTKIKEGEKREEEEKFEILRRTEFYKLFEAGILNNSLDATSSKAVWKHNSFYCCHKTVSPKIQALQCHILLKSRTSMFKKGIL